MYKYIPGKILEFTSVMRLTEEEVQRWLSTQLSCQESACQKARNVVNDQPSISVKVGVTFIVP